MALAYTAKSSSVSLDPKSVADAFILSFTKERFVVKHAFFFSFSGETGDTQSNAKRFGLVLT